MSTNLFTDVRAAFSKAIEPYVGPVWLKDNEAKGRSRLTRGVDQAADAVTRSILKLNRTDSHRVEEWHKVASDGPFLESLIKATVIEKLQLPPDKAIVYNTHFTELGVDPKSDEKNRLYAALESRFDVLIPDKTFFTN